MAPTAMAPAARPPRQTAGPVEQKTVTIIDGSSGARRDVTVPGGDGEAPAAPARQLPRRPHQRRP